MRTRLLRAVVAAASLAAAAASAAQDIVVAVHRLPAAPTLDGKAGDWAQLPAVAVPLVRRASGAPGGATRAHITAAHVAGRVYFLVQWPDARANGGHGPQGPRADRLALQFAAAGAGRIAGRPFASDLWHWQAARGGERATRAGEQTRAAARRPVGPPPVAELVAASMVAARQPFAAPPHPVAAAGHGRRLAMLPAAAPPPAPSRGGAVLGVTARGVWRAGRWTLELSRLMDTGNPGDVAFHLGEDVAGGVAIFDPAESDVHAESPVLLFRF